MAQSAPMPATTPPMKALSLPAVMLDGVRMAKPSGTVGEAERYCDKKSLTDTSGRIVETSNRGADHRVRQKLADGITGTPAQRCVIDKSERGLRVNGYVVL